MTKYIIIFALAWCSPAAYAAPPSTPVNSSPANNATGVDPWVALTISASSLNGYDSVVYELDTVNTFNSMRFMRTPKYLASSGAKRISWLQFNRAYYWRTRGFKAGDSSAWSVFWKFTTSTGAITLTQPSTYNVTTLCGGTSSTWPGETIEFEIDTLPGFNSPGKISTRLPKLCPNSCSRISRFTPWDSNYMRVRSINGPYIGAWSNMTRFYVKLTLVPVTPAVVQGDDIVNINFSPWGMYCNGDSSLQFVLYQDTVPGFNSPALKLYWSLLPGSFQKLVPNATNYFKFRYIVPDKKIDTTYSKVYSLRGPDGTISYTGTSSVHDYTFTFPSKIKTFEMEFDTTLNFNTGKRFLQTVNAKGMSTYTLNLRPTVKYIRCFMRYRVTTDSSVFPWILFRNTRVLTPDIICAPKATDTVVYTNPAVTCKNLDTATYYNFQMDYNPTFTSPNKKTKKYNGPSMSQYWYADTINWKQTVYFRVYIKSKTSATDWSPTYMYTPKSKIYKSLDKSLNYPYLSKGSSSNIGGASKIEFQVFNDTNKAPIGQQLYCLGDNTFSVNPNNRYTNYYYFRLRYHNIRGISAWSAFSGCNFVAASPSSLVDLRTPIDCSGGSAGYVTFRWHPNPNIVLYKLTYTSDFPVPSSYKYAWVTDTFFTVYLEPSKNYQWAVQGVESGKQLSTITKYFSYKTSTDISSSVDQFTYTTRPVLFPNPAQNSVHISDNVRAGQVVLYNLTGSAVNPGQYNVQGNEIEISLLPAGIYYCCVRAGLAMYRLKLIKE